MGLFVLTPWRDLLDGRRTTLSPGTDRKLLRAIESKSSVQSLQDKVKRMICCLQKKKKNLYFMNKKYLANIRALWRGAGMSSASPCSPAILGASSGDPLVSQEPVTDPA